MESDNNFTDNNYRINNNNGKTNTYFNYNKEPKILTVTETRITYK
jgi:hypothetical protein